MVSLTPVTTEKEERDKRKEKKYQIINWGEMLNVFLSV